MRAFGNAELLSVWEQGVDQPPVQRALMLLTAACPEMSLQMLARLSIGERDARLLTLREWMLGSQLYSVVACPQCGRQLELTTDTADLRADPVEPMSPGASPRAGAEGDSQSVTVTCGGYMVRFRLPNSLDLIAMSDADTVPGAQQVLLERCVLSACQDGEDRAAGALPAEVVTALAERMAEADPQADLQLSIECPCCGHAWQAGLDVVSYFWNEIDAWAHRILREVHKLALAYGWDEADILAMSVWRRQCYLELLGA